MAGHASACLHFARLLVRESLSTSRSRLPHRFRKRVRCRVHVSLRGRDVRVPRQHLQLVAWHTIIRDGSYKGRLWTYLDPLGRQVVFDATPTHERDGPETFLTAFQGALQADAYTGY